MEAKGHEFIEKNLSGFLENMVMAHSQKPLNLKGCKQIVQMHYNKIMKSLFIILLFNVSACNFISNKTNQKIQQSYHFKPTKDSTMCGAWGAVIRDRQSGYIPVTTESYKMVYIYSKNNKIYVPNEIYRNYDTAENTKRGMELYTMFNYDNDEYIYESNNSIKNTLTGVRFKITNENELKYLDLTYRNNDTTEKEIFTFQPYYFKQTKSN